MPDVGDVFMSGLGAEAAAQLGAGSAEVSARIRQSEKDEVSVSSQEAAAEANYSASAPPASHPRLPGPDQDSDKAVDGPKKKAAKPSWLALAEAAGAASLAGAWADAVSRATVEREDFENSPITRASEDYLRDIKQRPSPYSTSHTVTGTLAIGTYFIGFLGQQNVASSGSSISYNAIVDSMQQVNPAIGGPGDMRAELGLIGATFAYGAVLQATWITVTEAGQSEGRTLTQQFAQNYAKRLLALCNDENYTDYLKNLITHHMEGGEPASTEQMNSWVAAAKIGMLLSGLGLLYQTETGGMSGAEVAGLLGPDAPAIAATDPKGPIIAQIKAYLAQIPDARSREAILSNIMQFLDSHSSQEDLTNPLQILAGVLNGDESVGQRKLVEPA